MASKLTGETLNEVRKYIAPFRAHSTTLDGAQPLLVVPIVVDFVQEFNRLPLSMEGLTHLCFLWFGREPVRL